MHLASFYLQNIQRAHNLYKTSPASKLVPNYNIININCQHPNINVIEDSLLF